MLVEREVILDHLRNDVCIVKFTKTDGTERVMKCTLISDKIPEDKKPTGKGKKVQNDNIIAVYDLENEGWRSFKLDTIIEWTIEAQDMVD